MEQWLELLLCILSSKVICAHCYCHWKFLMGLNFQQSTASEWVMTKGRNFQRENAWVFAIKLVSSLGHFVSGRDPLYPQFTLYTAHCTLYIVHCKITLHIVNYTLHSVLYTLHTAYLTLHNASHSAHCTLNTAQVKTKCNSTVHWSLHKVCLTIYNSHLSLHSSLFTF